MASPPKATKPETPLQNAGSGPSGFNDGFKDIAKLEKDLWEAADNLRANSKLTSSDYFMPVLGVIFLRHAANRFEAAGQQIQADQASGKMPKRKVLAADYIARRSLYLPEAARYDAIMDQAAVSGKDLPTLVIDAMTAIEGSFEPLQGVLPKAYGIFEPKVLEDLMRLFNSGKIRQASGDVFGRIYEYFLAEFSIQKAHDNGEFFTPSSLVQTIVNVIEPDHGTVFDPACGSGGMFVQSSHFIEHEGQDTAKRVLFYGQEKNRDTIRIALMNLAVHGLEGKIAEAITYYQDEHNLVGKCDFVIANPPFNVDLVDAERIKGDPRLPFGLPGVNKAKKVSNGNYLWISYFWSYLNEKGRAGFVMSSQASSAAHGERDVRRKIVETGDVDVIISIRTNFFYTRSVPCELWHLDRAKPLERKNRVLMIDARNIYRKVTRKINDFSAEQLRNIAAIVWLYRGQRERFLSLVHDYLRSVAAAAAEIPESVKELQGRTEFVQQQFSPLTLSSPQSKPIDEPLTRTLNETLSLFHTSVGPLMEDLKQFLGALSKMRNALNGDQPLDNAEQHKIRERLDPFVESIRGLIKQVDLIYKLSVQVIEQVTEIPEDVLSSKSYDRRAGSLSIKEFDAARRAMVSRLRVLVYYYRHIAWLQERFPNAEWRPVAGLANAPGLDEIEKADWVLTPGRYVGVPPLEESEDFDFDQTMRELHTELNDLDREAAHLAAKLKTTFEEIVV